MNAATINKDMLPTDTGALHALVRELLGRLKISDLRADRAEYKLRDLIRRLYGSKNERLNEAHRQLFGILEEQINPEPRVPVMQKAATKTSGKKKGGGRHPKPENLPIKRRLIDLPEEQKVGLIRLESVKKSPNKSSSARVSFIGCTWCGRCTRIRRRTTRRSWPRSHRK